MEYLRSLPNLDDFSVSELCTALRDIGFDLNSNAKQSQQTINQIISELYSIAGTQNFTMSPDRWENVKYNIYLFLSTQQYSSDLIPPLSLKTDFGPTFFVLTYIIYNKKLTNQYYFKQATEIFENFKKILETGTSPDNFYIQSPISFGKYIPSIIFNGSRDDAINLLDSAFNYIRKKNDLILSNEDTEKFMLIFHAYQFIYDILTPLRNREKDFANQKGKIMMVHIINKNPLSFILISQYFDFISGIFSKNCQLTDKYQEYINFFDIFSKISKSNLNEVLKNIKIVQETMNLFTNLTDKRHLISTMHFLSHVFSPNNISHENPQTIEKLENSTKFIYKLREKYNEGNKWPYLFFIDKLCNFFDFAISKINQIKGIKVGSTAPKYITFLEQTSDTNSKSINNLLFSKYEVTFFTNEEEAFNEYNKSLRTFDIYRKLPLQFFFLKELFLNDERNNNNNTDEGISHYKFHLERLLKCFLNYFICLSYRFMLLNTFFSTQYSVRPLPNFSLEKNYLWMKDQKFNKELFVEVFVDCLFTATRRHILTQHFLTSFMSHFKDTELLRSILMHMLYRAYSMIRTLNDLDHSTVVLFQQWILLILKLKEKQPDQEPDLSFASILRSYMNPFLVMISFANTIFQPKLFWHRYEMINTMLHYMAAIKNNSSKDMISNFDNQNKDLQQILLKFPRSDFIKIKDEDEAARLLFDKIAYLTPDYKNFDQNFLIHAFKTDDINTLEAALNIAFTRIENKFISFINDEEVINSYFFKQMYGALKKVPFELFLKLIKSQKLMLAPFFIPWKQYPHNRNKKHFILDSIQVPLTNVFQCLKIDSSRNEFESNHILMLISNLISNHDILELSYNNLEILIYHLFSLSKFKKLHSYIADCFAKMHFIFMNKIKSEESFTYIDALIFSIQIILPDIEYFHKFLIFTLDTFTDILKENITISTSKKIFDHILESVRSPLFIFNILDFLTLLTKKIPESITISHFLNLFKILKDKIFYSSQFLSLPKIIYQFLMECINTFDTNEKKREFFTILNDQIKSPNIPNSIKYFIFKVITTLGIPLDIQKIEIPLNNASKEQNYIFLFELSIAISCGTSSPISFPIDSIERIFKESDPRSLFYSLWAKLAVLQALANPKIEIKLFQNKSIETYDYINNLISNGYNFQNMKEDYECCIKWLFKTFPEFLSEQSKKLISFLERAKIDDLNYTKIHRNLQYFSSFLSYYSTKDHLFLILKRIFLFSQLKDEEKLLNIHFFIQLIKLLYRIDFTQNELKSFISNEKNILVLIHSLCIILSNKTIPSHGFLFRFLMKLFPIFKEEIMIALLNYSCRTDSKIYNIFDESHDIKITYPEIKTAHELILLLIQKDETNLCLHKFLKLVEPASTSFKSLYPSVFDIEYKLSKDPKISNKIQFSRVVDLQFQFLFKREHDEYFSDNDSYMLFCVVKSYINIIQLNPEFSTIYELALFFSNSYNTYSRLYILYKKKIFSNRNREFYLGMFNSILKFIESGHESDQEFSAASIIFSTLIKRMGKNLLSETALFSRLISTFKQMIGIQKTMYCGMKGLYSLLKINPNISFNDILPVIAIIPKNLSQSEPYIIRMTLKVTLELANYNLIPSFIFSQILRYIFEFPKFLELPYRKISFLLLRKAEDFYKQNSSSESKNGSKAQSYIPEEVGNSFKLFVTDKIFQYRYFDLIEQLLSLVPSFLHYIPFSLPIVLVNLIKKKIDYLKFQPNSLSPSKRNEFMEKSYNELYRITPILCYSFKFLHFIKEDFKDDFYIALTSSEVLLLIFECKIPSSKLPYFEYFLNEWESLLFRIFRHLGISADLPQSYNKIAKLSSQDQYNFRTLNNNIVRLFNFSIDNFDENIEKYSSIIILLLSFIETKKIIENKIKIQKSLSQILIHHTNLYPNYLQIYIRNIYTKDDLSKEFPILESQVPNGIITFLDNYIKYSNQTNKCEIAFHLFEKNSSLPSYQFANKMLSLIKYIDIDQQLLYFKFFMRKISKTSNYFLTLKTIKSILNNSSVSNKVKYTFLEKLPKMLPYYDINLIEKIHKYVVQLPFETNKYQIFLLLYEYIKCQNNSKILIHEKLYSLFLTKINSFQNNDSSNEEICTVHERYRFISLSSILNPNLWTNELLPHLIFLILEQSRSTLLKPLSMICSRFKRIGSKLAIPLFSRILNNETYPIMHHMLNTILHLKNPQDYSQIICSLTHCIISKEKIGISLNLLSKSAQITNINYLLEERLNKIIQNEFKNNNIEKNLSTFKNLEIPDKFLLPHELNDDVFCLLPENTSIKSLSASAQFFLGNYEQANTIFSNTNCVDIDLEESLNKSKNSIPFLKRISEISHDIASPSKTITQVFERNGQNISSIIKYLLEKIQTSSNDFQTRDIDQLKLWLFNYFRNHEQLTLFEKQKIIVIHFLISSIMEKISIDSSINTRKYRKDFYLSFCVFPVIMKKIKIFETQLFGRIHNEITCKYVKNDPNTDIVLSHEFKFMFSTISGTDAHGFFSVSYQTIQNELVNNDFQKKYKNLNEWPGFCFSLMTSTSNLSPFLYDASLKGYLDLLKSDNPTFLQYSYAARVLTLLLSTNPKNENILQHERKYHKNFQEKPYLQFWLSQLFCLRNDESFRQVVDKLSLTTLDMPMLFYTHSLQTDAQFAKYFRILRYFENLLTKIFHIDCKYYENNQTFKSLLGKLNPSYKVEEIINDIDYFNTFLPIDIHFRDVLIPYQKVRIFRINSDFRRISENIMTFTTISDNLYSNAFIIERTSGVKESDSILTFSNFLYLLKHMIKFGYSSRVRGLNLSATLTCEIGQQYIIYQIPPSSQLFSELDDNAMNHQMSKLSKEYYKFKRSLISSFATYSLVRNIFSLDQPSLNDMLISFQTAEIPIIYNQIKLPNRNSPTATLIPKLFYQLFQASFDRKFALALASGAQTINMYIDAFRSIIEPCIIESHDNNTTLNHLLQMRDIIDATALDLAPPISETATEEDTIEWYTKLTDFIQRSKQPFHRQDVDPKSPYEHSLNNETYPFSLSGLSQDISWP